MTTRDELASARYMALTTYRRSGEPVTCPVRVVPVGDGRVGFWTAMGSGTTRRLAHTARVVVQPSDVRGRVVAGSTPLEGEAEVVRSGPFFEEVHARVREEHGVVTTVARVLSALGPMRRRGLRYADAVVLVRV